MHYNREMPDRVLRPRSGSSAKSLLLTVLGEFTLTHGGSVWTSTIVDGLRLIGVSERNARQAIARLSEDGLLDPERHGRRTRWHLTESGTQLLKTGTDRIYGFGATGDEWDERWLVVLASVPEDQRPKRHQLRSRLGFAGFGFIGAGIAVSPHTEREGVANTILRDLDLGDNAIVLLAETGTFVPDAEILRRAWDLDILAERYTRFIDEFGPRRPASTDERFAALVELVHEWRRFPFSDPEIPHSLLPDAWPGRRAKRLFDAKHEAWSTWANAWFVKAEIDGS